MNIIKRLHNDKEFNHPFVRMSSMWLTGIFLIFYLKPSEKYGYLKGFFIALIVAPLPYFLCMFILGGLYKIVKRLR